MTIKWESNFDFDELEKHIIEQTVRHVKNRVHSVRCEEHGQYATVTAVVRTSENIQFEVQGCCEALVEKAQKVAIS